MNTVDPNEKVTVPEPSHEVADAVPAMASEPAQAEASIPEGEKAVPENLPKYHHHRSTALW